MKIKTKICSLILLSIIAISAATQNVLASEEIDEYSINEKIAAIGFGKFFVSDSKKEITNLFKKIDNYTEKQDLRKLKEFYDDNFINNDGFDKDTYFKAVKTAFDNYKYTSANTEVKNVAVFDNYAIALVTENSEGKTLKDGENDNGLIISSADIYYYLTREGRKWKISSATVMDEKCSILYGEAKNIYFSLNVPLQVKAGSEYTSSLSFQPTKTHIVMAALSNEPITFPSQGLKKESYKTIKNDGILERILISNKDKYNEYAVASIGITAPELNGTKITVKLVGTAYVIRRVNVLSTKLQKVETPKSKKLNVNDECVTEHVKEEK